MTANHNEYVKKNARALEASGRFSFIVKFHQKTNGGDEYIASAVPGKEGWMET